MAKDNLLPQLDPLITAQNMASSFNGTPYKHFYRDNLGVQVYWTGATAGGTITFQVSLDYNPHEPNNAHWSTLQNNGTNVSIAPSGSSGTYYADFNQIAAACYFRIVYTTGGSAAGLLSALVSAKSLS